eukprot:1072671-Pyramimonas_sp.AAC.1
MTVLREYRYLQRARRLRQALDKRHSVTRTCGEAARDGVVGGAPHKARQLVALDHRHNLVHLQNQKSGGVSGEGRARAMHAQVPERGSIPGAVGRAVPTSLRAQHPEAL